MPRAVSPVELDRVQCHGSNPGELHAGEPPRSDRLASPVDPRSIGFQFPLPVRKCGDDGGLGAFLAENVDLVSDAAPSSAKDRRPFQGAHGDWVNPDEGAQDYPCQPLSPTFQDQAAAAEGADLVRLLDDPAPPETASEGRAARAVEDFPIGACPEGRQQDAGSDAREAQPSEQPLRDAAAQVDSENRHRPLEPRPLELVRNLDRSPATFAIATDESCRFAVAGSVT